MSLKDFLAMVIGGTIGAILGCFIAYWIVIYLIF